MALAVQPVANPTLTSVRSATGGLQGAGGIPNNATTITVPGVNNTPANNSTTTNTAPAPASSTPTYQDKSNDIAIQKAGLAAIPGEEAAGTGAVTDALNKVSGQYQSDLDAANKDYTTESQTNNQDLQTNKQTALEQAVQGRMGLYGTLAALGALSGTGLIRANNAVRAGANQDLTTAANTFATNQAGLDKAYKDYKSQEEQGITSAQQAAANDTTIAKNNALKDEAAYLRNLIADYADEGHSAQAASFTDQLNGIMPQIAATDVPQLAIGYTGGAFSAPALAQYVGSANNTTVKTTPNNGTSVLNVPGLVAVNKKPGA